MPSADFIFKHFIIKQDKCAMKVGTDGLILGSYATPAGGIQRILDIGTGTGLLSLMMAQKSKALIDAIDIDKAAVEQATENFKNSSWATRLKVFHIPLQSFCPGYAYDLIISNPPFFEDHGSIAKSSAKDRQLARSHAGLSFKELIAHAERLLLPKGSFYIIIPAVAKEKLAALASEYKLYINALLAIKSREDSGVIRYILCLGKEELPLKSGQLVIYNEGRGYSMDYLMLTRDFYAKDMLARHTDL